MTGSHTRLAALAAAALFLAPALVAAESQDVPKTLIDFAQTTLVEFAKDPAIVQAVEAQNARGVLLERIKEMDRSWIATKIIDGFMWDLMRSRCSYLLMNFQLQHKFIAEAFVMDNKGALVGLTNKTSDYWQGDGAKFVESYKGGEGAIHYGDVEYDDSINEIVIQVSVPVMRGSRAIGAITFGISLDRWERR